MADEKLNTGSGEEKLPEAPAPVAADEPQAPAPEQTAAPTPQQEGPAQPEPGDVVVSFDKINELMNEKRQTARAEVEKEEAAKEPEEKTQEEPPAAGDGEPKKARRGRPPKEEKAEPAGKEAAKPRKGRPPKADKAALDEATPTKRDKLSRSGKKAAEVKAAPEPENAAPAPEQSPPEPAGDGEPKKARRGRPPKEEKAEPAGKEAAKPRKGRPPKADKAALDEATPTKRDKLSRSGKKAAEVKAAPEPENAAPAPEQSPPEPAAPPRPVEEGKLVYLKLSEMHPFHTFRPHPFKVRDDAKMQETVASIKANGVMVPGLARPEKDGNGYEIVAGHRRHHGCELAGLEEMPFIVREMTDHEAVQAMKDSNKQRDQTLPSELAALLELEVEDIKHQGGRLKNVAEGDIGKRSVEIVGEAHDMNYKKVMRYLRLNSLVPELLDKVDDKKMGFMPAVEISYIRPKNQRLIAVSIDGEQASPSLAQAKKLRELDKDGKLNGDVIDGILSEKKKEDRGVIISTAELEKYFGKEATPAKMKEQIMTLLDEWKEKQPPELAKAPKKMEQDK